MTASIPGYTYDEHLPTSPVTTGHLDLLLSTLLWTDDGEIMGVRHKSLPQAVRMEGVQFHPESILTEHGHAMLKNFLQ